MIITVLHSVVRKHYENHNVLVRACVALAALARVVGNSRWFGPTGACEALQSALRHHVNDSRTVRYIVTAAGNLCIVNHNRNRFGMLGFCGDLCHILQLHILDPDCAKACISTIWKLCENEDERSVNGVRVTSTVGEPSVETDLDMTEEGADELPVTRGVPEMSEFNSVVAGITNRDMFAQSGLANLIIEVMKRHMNKIDVMQAALRCLAILCTGKQRTKERDEFGLIGVCPVILDIMRNYSNDSMITLWGSFAIRALTESNQSNRLRFFECSMPSLLIKLLNSNKSDGFNQNIDAIICAISNLAIDCKENKLSFGENGACELLLEYLELNFRSIELCYLGLRALNAVVLDCEENVLKLSFSNAGETLMVVISRYPDEDGIVVNSLALVSNLTTNKVGFSRLSSNGILKIISLIQSKLERSNDSITFHACELIANLSQHATWQEKFGQLGLCKTLSVVLSRNLMIITKFDADQVRKDSKTANTMEINNIISILVESCRALVALVTENEANKQKFLSHGTLEVLTSSLESGTKIDETLSNAIIQAQSSLIGML